MTDQAKLAVDSLSSNQDAYIACLMETKASHNIPQSYRHAMATDPDRWMVPTVRDKTFQMIVEVELCFE